MHIYVYCTLYIYIYIYIHTYMYRKREIYNVASRPLLLPPPRPHARLRLAGAAQRETPQGDHTGPAARTPKFYRGHAERPHSPRNQI